MSKEHDRIISLLDAENIQLVELREPMIIELAPKEWCYGVKSFDIKLYIYEFYNETDLTNSFSEIDTLSPEEGYKFDFAQNGPFLLIVQFSDDRKTEEKVDQILSTFSGVVER